MIALAVFVVVALLAFALAGYAWVSDRRRRLTVERALSAATVPDAPNRVTSLGADSRLPEGLRAWLTNYTPARWVGDIVVRERLLWAGFESDEASLAYAGVRVALLVALPAIVVLIALIALRNSLLDAVLAGAAALIVAWLIPPLALDVTVRRRQARIRLDE
jgi:hypothetical protein